MNRVISINMQTPYLTQYLGVWAILESAADLLRDSAAGIDWNVHVARQIELREKATRGAAAAGGEPQPSMYSYNLTPDGIAVIEVVGSLMKAESSWSDSTSTVMLRRTVRHAVGNDRVRAIMLRVDSPGGMVSGTEELADEIRAAGAKKPLAAYADGLMCSAAYWLGAQANWIASNETATVGSIGVLAVVQDRSAMAAQLGVKVHVIKSADAKGAGVPGTEITAKQLAEWQRQIDAMHGVFVQAVATGRGIGTEAAAKLADARVHVGRQNVEIGLTDFTESFDASLARLAAMKAPGRASLRAEQNSAAGASNESEKQDAGSEAVPLTAGGTESRAEAGGADVPPAEGAEAEPTGDTPEKGSDMSQTATAPGQQAPGTSATEQTKGEQATAAGQANEPKPATIGELKAAFPGDASFVLAAAENAWTLAEAKAAHAVIDSQVAARTASAAKQTETAAPAAKKPGVPATASAAAETAGGDGSAAAQLEAAIKPMVDGGMNRQKAVQKVLAENEQLRADYVAEKSAGGRA